MYSGVIVLSINGISDTISQIGKFDFETKNKSREIVQKYAPLMRDKARELAPKDTGTLAKSIRVRYFYNRMLAHIFPEDKVIKKRPEGKRQTYRHFIEYGTAERYSNGALFMGTTYRGRINGYFYMERARKAYGNQFLNDMQRLINREKVI